MLHLKRHPHRHWERFHHEFLSYRALVTNITLVSFVIMALVIFALSNRWWVTNPISRFFLNASQPVEKSFSQSPAKASVDSDSSEGLQALIRNLMQGQSPERRAAAMLSLKEAPGNVLPMLIQAQVNPDPNVRSGIAHVLGLRRAINTVPALFAATYDANAEVRKEALWALGELGAVQTYARVQHLAVVDTNVQVRNMATSAEGKLRASVADALELDPYAIREIAIAESNLQAYAITAMDLYAQNGKTWQRVGPLPNEVIAISVAGGAGNIVYIGTKDFGPFRSRDGGRTWEQIMYGLPSPTRLTITALAVNPENSNRVFVAVAAKPIPGRTEELPLGIYTTADGGDTWTFLPDAPQKITERLLMDPAWERFLFGISDETPWRYTLPEELCEYCLD